MPTVSLPFVLMIGLLAVVAGILNLAAPNPVYDMAALLLALYAVHGLGLRLAWRQQDEDETARTEDLQAELDRQRATLEAERAERSELERQWIGLASAKEH